MANVVVETGFDGGHGSHWDAVLEDPGELPRIVSEAYKRGAAGAGRVAALPTGAAQVRVRTLPLGAEGFEARLIELEFHGGEKPRVATVYPHLATAGSPIRLTPTRVIEWGREGLEAEVVAGAQGGEGGLAFFAVDYAEGGARYKRGEPLEVALSAVAYTGGIISPAPRLEEVGGKAVDISRASIVAPLKDSERAPYYDDDFFLQGPVLSCKPFAYPPWGEGAVVSLDLDAIGAMPVFVRKKDFPHGWPRPREFVAAYSWLQGRLSVDTP